MLFIVGCVPTLAQLQRVVVVYFPSPNNSTRSTSQCPPRLGCIINPKVGFFIFLFSFYFIFIPTNSALGTPIHSSWNLLFLLLLYSRIGLLGGKLSTLSSKLISSGRRPLDYISFSENIRKSFRRRQLMSLSLFFFLLFTSSFLSIFFSSERLTVNKNPHQK